MDSPVEEVVVANEEQFGALVDQLIEKVKPVKKVRKNKDKTTTAVPMDESLDPIEGQFKEFRSDVVKQLCVEATNGFVELMKNIGKFVDASEAINGVSFTFRGSKKGWKCAGKESRKQRPSKKCNVKRLKNDRN